jgi:hypothetical protein
MGRLPIFDVKSLKIGQKMPFPKRKQRYIYQYLNNFRKATGWDFEKTEDENGDFFVKRIA